MRLIFHIEDDKNEEQRRERGDLPQVTQLLTHSYLAGGLGPEPKTSVTQDESDVLSHLSHVHAERLSGVQLGRVQGWMSFQEMTS